MTLTKQQMGLKIKKARSIKSKKIGKRYTGQMLADDIGISRGYLGDLESGRTYPNYELLTKIANACGVSLSFFEEEENNNDKKDKLSEQVKYIKSLKLDSPEEALKFILQQPNFMAYGGYDLNDLSEDEIMELANDMLLAMKISIEKMKRK